MGLLMSCLYENDILQLQDQSHNVNPKQKCCTCNREIVTGGIDQCI